MLLRTFVVAVLAAATGMIAAPTQAASSCGGRAVTIQGGSGNNTINGTSHADVIDAGDGEDVVNGLGGNDIICGGEGSDDLRGNAGNDRLYGGLDRVEEEKVYGDMCVTMTPTGYCLVVWYYGDVLRGNSGNDRLVPGYDNRTFNTTVVGRSRIRDQLRWDTAPRAVTVNLTKGTATGDGGDSIIAAGLVRVVTSPYADTVVGTTEVDEIQSGSGADSVFARDGDDHYFGGSGPDTYRGGPGSDEYDNDLGGTDTCISVEVDPNAFCNSSTP